MGYPSLNKFICQELKYSESSANRRIQAMHLLKDVPEIASKLESGAINLTTATQVQSYLSAQKRSAVNGTLSLAGDSSGSLFSINQESGLLPIIDKPKPISKEVKQALLEKLENKSTREVEKHLLNLQGSEVLPQEKLRQITATMSELKLIMPEELIHMLDELKLKYSHINPKMTYQDLIKHLATKDLSPKKRNSDCTQSEFTNEPKAKATSTETPEVVCSTNQHRAKPAPKHPSRYIPAPLKRRIYERDKGSCTYTDHHSGRRCRSKHQLQFDHIKPFALGGKTEESNLRLLCASHNRYRAEKTFGPRR